uniref:BHLH domain-containing protein n=1 Tax=Panagrellus redivivus TaxID=6233 RepID=A0A7E4ULE8_PANRE
MSSEPDNDLEGSSSPASYMYHSTSSANSPTSTSPPTRNSSESPNTSSSPRKKCRQTANDNERRRMQTINEGFRALSDCVQSHNPKPDRKMSKANILKLTVHYIKNVEAKYREVRDTIIRFNDRTAAHELHIKNLTVALEKEHKLRMAYEQELVQIRMTSIKNATLSGIYAPVPQGASPNSYANFDKSGSGTGPFFSTGIN